VIKLIRHADAHRINVAAQLFDHRRRRAEANGKFAGSQRRFSAQQPRPARFQRHGTQAVAQAARNARTFCFVTANSTGKGPEFG